jgi:hypothetical protein
MQKNDSDNNKYNNNVTKSLINFAVITLHTDKSKPSPISLFQDETYEFGVLDIEINETTCVKRKQVFLFSIDMSASMQDICKDGRSQMNHAVFTSKNAISTIANIEGVDASIVVDCFDSSIVKVIQNTTISYDNESKLHYMLENKCIPRGSTNIELALKNAKNVIVKFIHIINIFLKKIIQ